MTAPNHALTGALLGLAISNPALALPLAFLSHFVLDAIPHYDLPGETSAEIIGSKQFFRQQILTGAILCFLLVVLLASFRPEHWLTAALCAFVATSPDLLAIPRFISVKRTGKDILERNWFWEFHHKIQWMVGPKFIWVEAAWFVVFGSLVAVRL